MLRHPFRLLFRLTGFFALCCAALLDYFCQIWVAGLVADYRARGKWLQRWSQRFLKLLCVKATYVGSPPQKGLLVSNHLSYIDILLLAAAQPTVFVARHDVRSWPLIGWLTRCAGTLFINRERKADVMDLAPSFDPVINQGLTLVLFPEGTSTGGDKVLPFLSSLFEPAVKNQWQTTAAWIGYSMEDGSVSDEVCYWRDMTFFPHFLNLLCKKSIEAKVMYEAPVAPGLDRKRLARMLHGQVTSFARQSRPASQQPQPDRRTVFAAPNTAF